jgi:hypothetical protein
MAAEDVINTAYLSTLGRPADPEGLAFYSAQLEAGRSVGEILADLNFAVESGIENVEANRQANATQNLTPQIQAARDASAGGGDNLPTVNLPVVNAPQLERNPVYPTLQVREDVNYDQLFGAKPLDQGGTAPTPEAINRAFETFYNRPADTAGIQGYLQSGKSMEQINADLAYQSLYAPELGLAQNAQYYEAPSQAQLGYIQSLGGGTPTFEREDTFTYTTPDPLTAEEVTSIYRDQFGYDPTPQDLEYWTQVYAMSPDVRYSANPRQQTINAILAGSDLPQYEYLKKDTDLTGTQGVNYKGTPINPTQLANQQYSDYRGAQPAPFGGFFGDDNFNPFDYTGIAPTPGMYRGYDPFATQRAAEINMLGNQYLGGNFEPQGMEFYSTQRSTGRSLADIAADLSASPEGQAFAQTRVPSPERAAISSSRSFAARSPTEAAETLRALDPSNQGIVAALPGSTASTP